MKLKLAIKKKIERPAIMEVYEGWYWLTIQLKDKCHKTERKLK